MRIPVRCKAVLIRSSLAIAVGWALAAALLCASGMRIPYGRADVAVIFGNALEPDGKPAPLLAERLDVGVDCFRKGDCARFIVSGSVDGPGLDEASAMRAYLVARGVPENRIAADNLGANTLATAHHTVAYMREKHLASVMLISQYYHLARASLAVRRVGGNAIAVYAAHPRAFHLRDVYSSWREVPAFAMYKIRLTLDPNASPVSVRPVRSVLNLFLICSESVALTRGAHPAITICRAGPLAGANRRFRGSGRLRFVIRYASRAGRRY